MTEVMIDTNTTKEEDYIKLGDWFIINDGDITTLATFGRFDSVSAKIFSFSEESYLNRYVDTVLKISDRWTTWYIEEILSTNLTPVTIKKIKKMEISVSC